MPTPKASAVLPDANALVVRWLKQAMATERVSSVVLPHWRPETGDGFRPEDGTWVVVSRRGGGAHSEAPFLTPSMQIRCWAGENQFPEASIRSLQVYTVLHGKTSVDFDVDGYVVRCRQEGGDQDVPDPDTGYATVLSFYELQITSNDYRNSDLGEF